MTNLRAYAREAAIRAGCDPDVFVRQIQQESGFNPDAFNAGSGATGIAQIIRRWHPDVDPTDPIASLDYAATWMASLRRQYGSYRMALAAYNWGPGNTANWNGERAGLPAETCSYLDVILGDGWPEPSSNGVGQVNLGNQEVPSAAGATNSTGASTDAVLHLRVARVAPSTLNMRAAPDLAAPAVTQLAEGTLVRPLGPARETDEITWVQVRASGGAQGWMSAKYLDVVAAVPADAESAAVPAPVQLPHPTQYRLTDSGVRLRARPGTGSGATVLATLNTGTVVDDDAADTVEANGHTWRRVRTGGQTGWVAAEFLEAVAGSPGSPAPVPAPVQLPHPTQYRLTDSGVRLRARPGTGPDATILTTLSTGAVVDDDGADTVEANGYTWRRVRSGGQTGWVATEFLEAVAHSERNGHDRQVLRGSMLQFDATAATEIQRQPWTCAIRSTMWMLRSIGRPVTPEEAQDAMSPRYCNSDFGLLDASGAGIVEVLRDTWGVTAHNQNPVSFEDVVGWAGRYPVAIGGRNWGGPGLGHWSAVRGVNDAGALELANPAGTGPRFGQQTLDREQWERMGSFSAVYIPIE